MKACGLCKIEKDESELCGWYKFGIRCKSCDAKYRKKYHEEHPRSNESIKKHNDLARNKLRKIKKDLVEYKGDKCEICGYSKCYAAMDFHHKDPMIKKFNIAKEMNKNKKASLEQLKREVDKCFLLCSNCHREAHYGIDNVG